MGAITNVPVPMNESLLSLKAVDSVAHSVVCIHLPLPQGEDFLIHSLFCQLLSVSTPNTRCDLLSGGSNFPSSLHLCLGFCKQGSIIGSAAKEEVGQPKGCISMSVLHSCFSVLRCRSAVNKH